VYMETCREDLSIGNHVGRNTFRSLQKKGKSRVECTRVKKRITSDGLQRGGGVHLYLTFEEEKELGHAHRSQNQGLEERVTRKLAARGPTGSSDFGGKGVFNLTGDRKRRGAGI